MKKCLSAGLVMLAVLTVGVNLPAAEFAIPYNGEILVWEVDGLSNVALDGFSGCSEVAGFKSYSCRYLADYPGRFFDIYDGTISYARISMNIDQQNLYNKAELFLNTNSSCYTPTPPTRSYCYNWCPFSDSNPDCANCIQYLSYTHLQEIPSPSYFRSYHSYSFLIYGFSASGIDPNYGSIVVYLDIRTPSGALPTEAGTQTDNPFTEFEGGDGQGACSLSGLPNYWVNTASLQLAVKDVDSYWQGLGPGIELSRTWNSGTDLPGMFGNGWRFTYESIIRATGTTSGKAYLVRGSGQWQDFSYSSHSTGVDTTVSIFNPDKSANLNHLTGYFGSESYFLYQEKDTRLIWRYDLVPDGKEAALYRLTSIYDRNGNAVSVQYNADGTISRRRRWPAAL